jgi:nitrate reductase cytochrome c-type subunit
MKTNHSFVITTFTACLLFTACNTAEQKNTTTEKENKPEPSEAPDGKHRMQHNDQTNYPISN